MRNCRGDRRAGNRQADGRTDEADDRTDEVDAWKRDRAVASEPMEAGR